LSFDAREVVRRFYIPISTKGLERQREQKKRGFRNGQNGAPDPRLSVVKQTARSRPLPLQGFRLNDQPD